MNDSDSDWDADRQLSEPAAAPTPKRELGFVPGGPIPDALFDALPDDELERWDSA